MKALVVDNEPHVVNLMTGMLEKFCPEITEVVKATSVADALSKIRAEAPGIAFLDIELDDGTGLDILRSLDHVNFQVVFATAYNQYAVDAFRFSAVDYLLKPVSPDDLISAVKKAVRNINLSEQSELLKVLRERMDPSHTGKKRMVLRDHDNIHVLNQDEIIYCEADGVYTRFYLDGKRQLMISKNLKEFEELLGSSGFLRVHNSFLANMKKVVSYLKADGGYLVLEQENKIPVSIRKKDQVMDYLKKL